MQNKLLIICGPTATGKTKLGIEMAKKFNGEIVSADSRQVYKGMNIGTGKDIGNLKFERGHYEIDGIKVWLLDIVEPSYKFNVADYKKCADVILEDIWKRGKLPIIVGGTGFYVKAVVDGIGTMGIEPDWGLRDELQKINISELQNQLEKLDVKRWAGMNESDRQNPRRLIRAIEVAQNVKGKMSDVKCECQMSNVNMLYIGLMAPFSTLYQRIDQRVEERVEDGLENEIKSLLAKGYNFENSVLGTTLAYREWKEFFDNKTPKEEIIQKWKFDEHNYARRQMTWFKKDKRINWFDIFDANIKSKVENMVKNWYIKVDA